MTLNQPFSYIGIVILNNRRLLPTAYTIRNGNSRNRAMLSWRLEATNDFVEWTTLDTRTHKL